ncbi:DUF1161 domain-containing protein [Pelomonas sp. APW6]|uniref:DUF1161 domain-containing protein n=1 Tax=Roseateles subflavus TaxID=3053353 RepID=A0ABT7LCB9_9BURK|nr:DUF1161 domain-containing protein [Pelomonas sp. APW6]MDL5030513.1 DUF1161 domain-containing protein [Pelomonas sp. APW6]
MNKIVATTLALAVSALTAPAFAAAKPCEELKTEIAAKLDEKGVKHYTLTVVENDKVGEAKVVGSCEGGSKKITYEKK